MFVHEKEICIILSIKFDILLSQLISYNDRIY